MKTQEIIKAYAYPVLAFVSTVGVVSIAFSLAPIAKWSQTKNDCIERTTAFDGLPDKVWSCNGGGS